MSDLLIRIIGFTLGAVVVILLGSLVLWGVGNLIIFVFHINYTWTFLHGLVAEFIYLIAKEIFGNRGVKNG